MPRFQRVWGISFAVLLLGALSACSEADTVSANKPASEDNDIGVEQPDAAQVASIEDWFADRYDVPGSDLLVVSLPADKAIELLGPDIVAAEPSVRLVYASGKFTDAMAHPPYGYEVPTGETAYLVLDDHWNVLGGGLFPDNRSEDLTRLGGRATPLTANS